MTIEEGDMKCMMSVILALTVASASGAGAQPRPDLSGTWTMDASRSDSAIQNEPIKRFTVVIAQTANEMTIESTRDGQTTTFTYRLDGVESKLPDGVATTHWEGSTLVTEMTRDIRGATVTTKESRHLDPGAKEMLVETIVVVQHGYSLRGTRNYGAGKDVFVRVNQK